MAYYNRRTIAPTKANVTARGAINPYTESGKLKKGYRYSGKGEITDKIGNTYLISDYK